MKSLTPAQITLIILISLALTMLVVGVKWYYCLLVVLIPVLLFIGLWIFVTFSSIAEEEIFNNSNDLEDGREF